MPFGPARTHVVVDNVAVPKKRKRRGEGPEAKEQKAWVTWARARGIEFVHLNNGAKNKIARIRLHAMGCAAGAADIVIFSRLPAAPEVRFLALEFKSPSGTQSSAQQAWQERCEAAGGAYHVVRSCGAGEGVCLGYGL